jgi:hypothetical protein
VIRRDDLVKIADHSLASPKAIDARDLSMLLAMSFTAGRGDDVRERRLCELTPPLLRTCIGEILHANFITYFHQKGFALLSCSHAVDCKPVAQVLTHVAAVIACMSSGPAHCWVIGILQTFGKNQGGKLATKGCLRHKEPLLDVQSALGRYFVTRFTLGGEVFPDPCSRDFLTVKIWPGRKDFSSSLSYGGHRARFAKIYMALDIRIKKVTHAPRYHTVRKADEAGVPEEVGTGGIKWARGKTWA